MSKIIISGGNKLVGEVVISGAKNAAVAIIPATILVKGKCHLENVPDISDIRTLFQILKSLGSKIRHISKNEVIIDNTNITTSIAPYDLTSKFRASYYILGALIGRFGNGQISLPGGCDLGARPIDQHLKAFKKLGVITELKRGNVYAKTDTVMAAANIFFDVVSVGATINAIIASALVPGITVLENCAKEPHVVDLANFLNSMGASIKGAGTDVIKVNGVEQLKQVSSYAIIPDQIEAGTFMVAAAITRGNVLIKNVIPKHMEPITSKLLEAGVTIHEFEDTIRVSMDKRPKIVNINTMPYPGFPTDMQPQMCVLMAIAEGSGIIVESIWDSRFQYTDELIKMGANISAHGKTAMVKGVEKLYGSPVHAHDLRAGAAMLLAGLISDGNTELFDIDHIERGYERIIEKFKGLGGNLKLAKDGSKKC